MWSSSSTRIASRSAIACAGLALLATGCARSPVAHRPARVYVAVDRLLPLHPQYPDLRDLDRRIAALSRISPKTAAPAKPIRLSVAAPYSGNVTVDLAKMESDIRGRLDNLYESERVARTRRLEKRSAQVRGPLIAAERGAVSQAAEQKFQAIIDEHKVEIRNQLIKREAIDALDRFYQTRGWDRTKLQADAAATDEAIAAIRARAAAQMDAVLSGFSEQLAQQARDDAAAQLAWLKNNRQDLDALDAETARQKRLLADAVADLSGGTEAFSAPSAAPLAPLDARITRAPAPAAALAVPIATMRDHRDVLARFIAQNARARVTAAAVRRNEQPVFAPEPGAPDRTEDYGPVVAAVQ